ncbi:hypothetical protein YASMINEVIRUS_554 [Yasminevirus sp. GU-2018]|uniref:Uncharacterized protein n=1 Tax=Yasminevirus sp. GU-2018 TaxID=2420051 RepID=A0A5K0U967_9VIRU|nr:hypothetical protein YASMINEVIRUS_554 [Yasminevirus sp. GU-2018]
MDLRSNSVSIKGECLRLNTDISSWSTMYGFFSERVTFNDKNKFIGSLYYGEALALRFEYTIIGTYNKSKNVWIWASESLTLDRSLIEHCNTLRESLRSDKRCSEFKQLIDSSYTVMPTQNVTNVLATFADVLYESANTRVITRPTEENIDVYAVKKIIFSMFD